MSETTSTAPVTEPQVAPAAPRSAKRPARPRKANAGDIAPSLQAASLERHTVNEAIAAAQLASGVAMEDILSQIQPGDTESMLKTLEVFLSGLAADDALALRNLLLSQENALPFNQKPLHPDDELADRKSVV